MTNHRKRRVRDMTAIYCGKRKGKRYEIMKVNSCHIPPLPFTPVPSRGPTRETVKRELDEGRPSER